VYGQVEATYRFGYYGLANTPTLKNIYEQQYGGVAEFFLPGVDTDMYHPGRSIDAGQSRRRHTVFFYGRPGHARNGFELGAAASKLLKKRLGARVAILCAGAEWRPEDHGLQGVLDNLGILTLKQAAALYRTCDAGLVMMFTKHPSYLPFELMASGCLVVTNKNRATEWLLEDGVNCLLTEATPSCIAETLERGLMNDAGRERIVRRARSLVESRFSSWDEEMEKMYGFMCGPKDKGKYQ
jgi:glycosyltransferase involved in cell wall biosynthesis